MHLVTPMDRDMHANERAGKKGDGYGTALKYMAMDLCTGP
jgi:hypothetical protein